MVHVDSGAISREIDELQAELSTLRTRMAEDNSSFSTLEQEISELRERLTHAEERVAVHEARLAEKRAELAEAKRLERLAAYEGRVRDYRKARTAVAAAATSFLAEVEVYDRATAGLQEFLDEMRAAFGEDERVAEVAAVLAEEPAELAGSWDAVSTALRGRRTDAPARTSPQFEDVAPSNGGEIAGEVEIRAEEVRPRARILEYFSKS
jgi:chromosome segregation ATPase